MSRMLSNVALAFALILLATSAHATSPFRNLDEIARDLGFAAYRNASSGTTTVKIAVLDNGFRNHSTEIGKTLPANTMYHAGPVAVDAANEDSHGLFMAQIISGLLAKTPGIKYELHLFSAFGYSNLQEAVHAVVADKYDVVLYSQVWDYGGNGDGKGFINALVNQATANGTIWINAAGNFADATYLAPVERIADDWAALPGPNASVQVRCHENPKKKNSPCKLRAVLSWNDFKDDVTLGTDKDLDLVLSDDTLKIIRTSGLKQVIGTSTEGGTSLYPREIIEAEVPPGLYYLRVKIRSSNFTKANDELRLVTSGDLTEQLDVSLANETLLAPADNASAITVGASDSTKSSQSASKGKPELSTPSSLRLGRDQEYKGSSNSAAITAAVAVVLKGLNSSATRAELLSQMSGGYTGSSDGGAGLPLSELGFSYTGPGCFNTTILQGVPRSAQPLLRDGAVSVATTQGVKLFTENDPFAAAGVRGSGARDMLLVNDQRGFFTQSRSSRGLIPPGTLEVVQRPQGEFYCAFDGSGPDREASSGTSGSGGGSLALPPVAGN